MIFKSSKEGEIIQSDLLFGYLRDGYVFSASIDLTSVSGNNETAFYLLKNPIGSGKNIITYQAVFGADSSTARTALRIYINPTITSNGTGLTENNNFLGSSVTTLTEAYSLPTISANGTFAGVFLRPSSEQSAIIYRHFIIPPGVNMLATVQNSIANTPTHFGLQWIEIPI